MAKLELIINADDILKYYRMGEENMFMALTDFDDLERQLNVSNIEITSEDE